MIRPFPLKTSAIRRFRPCRAILRGHQPGPAPVSRLLWAYLIGAAVVVVVAPAALAAPSASASGSATDAAPTAGQKSAHPPATSLHHDGHRGAAEQADQADPGKASRSHGSAADGKTVVTTRSVNVQGRTLHYTATTGRLRVHGPSGKPRADYFFVAYELQSMGGKGRRRKVHRGSRPITFVFNGGPGAAAVWLHLGAIGPARLKLTPQGRPIGPPYHLQVNQQTWLGLSDLVFVDPVGTGYSRPAPGVDAKQFYGVTNDIHSISRFIYQYLGWSGRWASPKFLAGESYGTTRAAGLAAHLLDRYGITLNGIVLISSALDFHAIEPADNNDLPYALYLPTYTATAWRHHRLAQPLQRRKLKPLLKDVAHWSLTRYVSALARGGDLSKGRRGEIARTLARFTGLPLDFIQRSNLRISPTSFRKKLLQKSRRLVGRFDTRIAGPDLDAAHNWPGYDPALAYYRPIYSSAFNHYVRRVLNYHSDLTYEVLTNHVQPWSFNQGGRGEGQGYLDLADDLRKAMIKQPHMKVLIAAGYFDLATPFLSANYVVAHMNLPAPLRANLTQTYYRAGHMMFHNRPSLRKLRRDVGELYAHALGSKGGEGPRRPAASEAAH